ncbi:MAG: hypothetical protein ORN58_02960 [Sediminibacterium sp.]|nr:hypothetical protein [Sediminibacterium sp.]
MQKFGLPTLHATYKENPFGENQDLENIPSPDTISSQKDDPNLKITKEALQDYNGGGHIITNDSITINALTNKLEAGSYQFFQQFLELNFRHITALLLGHENALTAVKNRGTGLDNKLITPEQIALEMKETSDLTGIIDDLNDPETGLINKLPRLGIRVKIGERIMSEDLITKEQTNEKVANLDSLSKILGSLSNTGYELDPKTLNEIMLDYGIKLNKIKNVL